MKLLIISHKEVWKDKDTYSTSGGFPFQINAMTKMFTETRLVCALKRKSPKKNLLKITGNNLKITPLIEPWFTGWRRQMAISVWAMINFKSMFRAINSSEVVHTMIPGDIGLIGTMIALLMKKPLFIRHCGTWGNRTTITDRFIYWLLPKIAKQKTVVMATGGGKNNPEKSNKEIRWIFSTSISKYEWNNLKLSKPWDKHNTLNIITVARLTYDKNIHSIIRAIYKLKDKLKIHLNIIGDGSEHNELINLTKLLRLEKSITFFGNSSHEEVLEHLSKNHLFIFPTNTKEGFPKALLEAMACGLPCIATRVSVIPHLIENQCGLVLDKTDPNTISNAIIHMTSDLEKMLQMANNSRVVSKIYTIENWKSLIEKRLVRAGIL